MGRSSVNPLFRKIICFQIIMDMLYKAERYEDIIDLYPISLECFPASSQNIITAVFAALYQMVSYLCHFTKEFLCVYNELAHRLRSACIIVQPETGFCISPLQGSH